MDEYKEAYVILPDGETYGSVEGAEVTRTLYYLSIERIEENVGADRVAQELKGFGDTVTIERLLAVYDAAKALSDAKWDDDGIGEEVLACIDNVYKTVYES